MLRIATTLRPHQVSLVPERPEEVTTEGGLDLVAHAERIRPVVDRLATCGIAVSLFIDPAPAQLDALADLGPELVHGFEINTDAYTRAFAPHDPAASAAELHLVQQAATAGASRGFRVYAGHGLTTANVVAVAAVPEIEELNIGHWLISRSTLVGLGVAVQEMLAAMQQGRAAQGGWR